eukprot:5456671-Ditylum_brightwellii.AAC.1
MNLKQLPKVGIIEASDSCVNHTNGFCNKWIFDSNLSHVMPLSKDNLNVCASTADSSEHFVRLDA